MKTKIIVLLGRPGGGRRESGGVPAVPRQFGFRVLWGSKKQYR
jgi:hypothetical protein